MRWLTAGESHGPELIGIIEGLPAGIPVSMDTIQSDLARRRLGYGRGARMKFEAGPHRVQQVDWQQATRDRLDLAEQWLTAGG